MQIVTKTNLLILGLIIKVFKINSQQKAGRYYFRIKNPVFSLSNFLAQATVLFRKIPYLEVFKTYAKVAFAAGKPGILLS